MLRGPRRFTSSGAEDETADSGAETAGRKLNIRSLLFAFLSEAAQ